MAAMVNNSFHQGSSTKGRCTAFIFSSCSMSNHAQISDVTADVLLECQRALQLTSSTASIRPREETKGREAECSAGERCTYLSMSAILAESQVMLKREKRQEEKVIS